MLYREIIAVCSEIHTKHINTICGQNVGFLCALEKLREATLSFVMPVCVSVRLSAWNNSAPTGRIFMKLGISSFSEEIRKWKANWIGHILRRNCFLQRVSEEYIKGGIEVTERRGRRRRKLLDDLNP